MTKTCQLVAVLLLAVGTACSGSEAPDTAHDRTGDRENMVERDIAARGVTDESVLKAMRAVRRHEFVPQKLRRMAYADRPLPIGEGQTISQPFIVAYMTQLLQPQPGDVVLEVGTGSGYQAAVLAEIVKHVYTIEIVEPLGVRARDLLKELGYENVTVRIGDGYIGWEEHAPFDSIVVTAAPDHVPEPLIEQLAPGGRLVIPVGPQGIGQDLRVIEKKPDGTITERNVLPVRFVPLTGERVTD